MYTAYEICTAADCHCDHHHGVTRAENVSLVEAFYSLHLSAGFGYESYIEGPRGTRRIPDRCVLVYPAR